MIIGVGIDLTRISRIEESLKKPGFEDKFFSVRERVMFAKRGNRAETIAANFAAKEAFGKAMGTGLSGFKWQELSVLRTEIGAPYLAYEGSLSELVDQRKWRAHVSLTHEDNFASAYVIIEEL